MERFYKMKITFKDLKIGDTINYDIPLKQNNYKNETMLVLAKDDQTVKLSGLTTWYCSKNFFNQLVNVSIIEND